MFEKQPNSADEQSYAAKTVMPGAVSVTDSLPSVGGHRPLAVTVIGIFLLIFAMANILMRGGRVFVLLAGKGATGIIFPDWLAIMLLVFGIIVGIALGIMGVGLLKMAQWARVGAILTLYGLLVLAIVSAIITMYGIITPNDMRVEVVTLLRFTLGALLAFYALLVLGIAGTLNYVLTRPAVLRAFACVSTLARLR